ncbi:MAG: single-stranded DNA-binding protein [Bacteroidetes bacterium]|nr:single-stranded DNA-binding protein [Bacteroidota bacterium]
MIKLMAIGNLGKDCNVNTVNGKNVINFSIAHTEKFKDSAGAPREKTTWVECAYWTDRTGISPYLKKGTQVYVEGTPEIRTYQTNDGKSGASLSLRVHSIQLLGSRAEGLGNPQPQSGGERNYDYGNNGSSTSTAQNQTNNDDMNEASDDLPF